MAAVTLPTHYRNVFAEQGYAQAEIDARIENANYGSAIDHLKYRHDEFHLVPVLDESGNIAGRNFIENARTKNIPEIHVQMMANGNRTTDSTKAPPCTKSTMLSGAGGVVVQFSRSAKTINLRS